VIELLDAAAFGFNDREASNLNGLLLAKRATSLRSNAFSFDLLSYFDRSAVNQDSAKCY